MSIPDNTENQTVAHNTDQNDEPSPDTRDTRMFIRGTGSLFQAIGMVWLFSACGVWFLSGYVVEPASHPPQQWRSYLAGEHLPASLLAIGILASFVGGLGLSATGMGLQGERPSSGKAALIVCSCLTIIFWGIAFSYVVLAKQWIGGAVAALLGLASTVLLLFAWRCAYEIKRDPPPQDSVVTEEFLEKYRRERAERLSKYDP